MAHLLSASAHQAQTQRRKSSKWLRRKHVYVILAAVTASVGLLRVAGSLLYRKPQHTSILTGDLYLWELLAGNQQSFFDVFGLSQDTFWCLHSELIAYGGLRNGRSISAAEKLATFLYQCRSGLSIRILKN